MEYSSKFKLIIRLLISPIILALMLVTYLVNTIRMFIMFIRYGGEWITYDNNEMKSIEKIYKHLKTNQNDTTTSI